MIEVEGNVDDLRIVIHDLRNAISTVVTSSRCLGQPLTEKQRDRFGQALERGADDAAELLQRLDELLDDEVTTGE